MCSEDQNKNNFLFVGKDQNLDYPSFEETILEDFLKSYTFSGAKKFAKLEKEFLGSLDKKQKDLYLRIVDAFHVCSYEREYQLILFAKNRLFPRYGRLFCD